MENLTLTDVSSPERRAALAARLARDLGAPPTIRHDLDWMKADAQNRHARLLVLLSESEQGVRWYLPLAAYPYRLRVAVGPQALWRARVVRAESRDLRTLQGADAAQTEERVVGALAALRRALPGDTVLFFDCIPEDSPARRALTRQAKLPSGYHPLCFGPPYMHRTADIGGGLEAYLQRLGSKTRADLRRTRRRFEQTVGSDRELFVARTESDLDRLVDAVLEVAPTTWQYQQEKAGPRDRDLLLAKCGVAAQRSVLRSYVLFTNGKPIAFQIGHVADGVFDAHEIGYDPAWRKSQPGILLHMAIVEDLAAAVPDVTRFDFGITDRLHKARLSTEASEEGFYYLFPNSARGRLLYFGLRATMALTDGLKAARKRLQRAAGP